MHILRNSQPSLALKWLCSLNQSRDQIIVLFVILCCLKPAHKKKKPSNNNNSLIFVFQTVLQCLNGISINWVKRSLVSFAVCFSVCRIFVRRSVDMNFSMDTFPRNWLHILKILRDAIPGPEMMWMEVD